MTVYIAGPMKGKPDLNRPAFMQAARELEALGYKVLNPATLPMGIPEAKYLPICLAMVEACDVIALLPGWEASGGATIERAFADYQGKRAASVSWLLGKDASEWE